MGRSLANALTTLRLLLVVPFGFFMARGDAREAAFAALALTVAIATDVLDGRVARRGGTVTAAGGIFDHATDCLFVTTGLAAGATRGAFPWILPVLVIAAFTQYVVDSRWSPGRGGLRASRLGRYNGILYFVPLAGDVLVRLGFAVLRPVTAVLAWALVASTLVSMGQRLLASRSGGREEFAGGAPEEQ